MTRFPGFAISGYRSLSGAPQWIPLDASVMVVLGGNNSGKSNVLRLVHEHMGTIFRSVKTRSALSGFQERLDKPRGDAATGLRVHWPINEELLDPVARRVSLDNFKRVLDLPLLREYGTLTVPLAAENFESALDVPKSVGVELAENASSIPWGPLSSSLTGQSGGSKGEDPRRVLSWILEGAAEPPETVFVPPSRFLRPGNRDEWDFGGEGVIDRLNRMRNPEFDQEHYRQQVRTLTDDLRALLEDDELVFEVPHDLSTLNVRLGGEYYPLNVLGTGTEHAVLILAAAHVFPNHLMCLEEPDAHFHPRLQRQLMTLLRRRAKAGVLIATHSAHVIDAASDRVVAVRYESGRSELSPVGSPSLFQELRALGYRASDLLQANAIIWVEGPSDRIHLLHWVRAVAPELQEGIDFSIVFYGGALLKRLSATLPDPIEPSLIDLWRINQRMWIVMDSDIGERQLKPDVVRLSHEIDEAGRGGTWVTDGYTMENYVPPELLLAAVREVHPTVVGIARPTKKRDPLKHLLRKNGTVLTKVDKVAIALAVAERPAVIDRYDLKERLSELTEFISGE